MIVFGASSPAASGQRTSTESQRQPPTGPAQEPPKAEINHSPAVVWRFRAEPKIGLSDPLVTDGLVIVGDDLGVLRALRTKDGKEVWKHEDGKRIYDAPTCDAERIYFTTSEGVVAVSRKDGRIQWNQPIKLGAGRCLVVKGMVLAGGNDGFVYAYDADTKGDVRWQTDVFTDAPPAPPGFPGERARGGFCLARPTGMASDGGMLCQNLFDQSRVVALEVSSGKLLWSYQAGGWMYGAPAVADNHVLVGSQDKFLHCLEKKTGKFVWKFKTASRIEASPVVEGSSVFFASCDGGFYRVSLAEGKQVWRFDTDADYTGRKAIYSTPILTRDTIYFTAGEGKVYALNKETGKLRWKLRASEKSQTYSSPASDGQRLFVVTRPDWDKRGESSLVAIDLKQKN
jgi:outer membrane protein assembly factor BamB